MNKSEEKLYNFILEWVLDNSQESESLAQAIIKGNMMGYLYGKAGYVIRNEGEDEFFDSQVKHGAIELSDTALDHDYLIGVMV